MPINQDQVTKEINLNLPDFLPDNVKDEVKAAVGDYVVTSILDYVGQGESPVGGQKAFKKLSKEYAHYEKGDRTLPNLELNGDMLRALEFKATDKGIEVGIFDSSQAPKAYNHNVGDTLPKRQFIPDRSQKFKQEIERGINDIVNKTLMESASTEEGTTTVRVKPRSTPSDTRSTQEIRASLDASTPTTNSAFDAFVKSFFSGE